LVTDPRIARAGRNVAPAARGVAIRTRETAMKLANILKNFRGDDRGMETVEWAIMAAILVAGLIGVIAGLGNNVLTSFTTLQTATH
jgi:Flp pilus assembly pilin Flp